MRHAGTCVLVAFMQMGSSFHQGGRIDRLDGENGFLIEDIDTLADPSIGNGR